MDVYKKGTIVTMTTYRSLPQLGCQNVAREDKCRIDE